MVNVQHAKQLSAVAHSKSKLRLFSMYNDEYMEYIYYARFKNKIADLSKI
jgi:hypothetical protein